MGSANPRSFSRGKRGIAGTLVFVMFDHDALIEGLKEHVKANKVFHRKGGSSHGTLDWDPMTIEDWDSAMADIANTGSTNNSGTINEAVSRTQAISQYDDPVIADEIPPFDITISMANEYGAAAVMVIYGVEILNEGSQFSMDNIQSQMACTFVARRLTSLQAVPLTA